MNYYVIAGEPSGDLHGSNMIRELKALDPQAEFRYWGGDLMQEQTGVAPVKHIRDISFMGFVEVFLNLRTILGNIAFCKEDILAHRPDVLVLVDYPGFNLRIADWAKQQGIRVHYYISPTIWAWKENRVEIVKRAVKRMFVILPFEVAVYQKHGYKADFVGHPLLDAIHQQKANMPSREAFLQQNQLPDKPIIAVLPGSRQQEIQRMMQEMLTVVSQFPKYQFVIAASKNIPAAFYDSARQQGIAVIYDQTYPLMRYAEAGIIKSGTSTLESGLFQLPMVVCYKGGQLSYLIARSLVKVKYISLVNLILDRPAVKELIQQDMTGKNIAEELHRLLDDSEYRKAQLQAYTQLETQLGGLGASKRLAQLMIDDLKAG